MPSSASIWTEHRQRPVTGFADALPTTASVVVVGAGVCGLVTAAMLDDHGVDVVVVDAGNGFQSTSAHSSAKVSLLHELTAAKVAQRRGRHMALEYVRANQFGCHWITRYIEDRNVECAWEHRDAVTYVNDLSSFDELDAEAELHVAAGVDIASEYYLAITTDRATRRNVLIASKEGGVDIEIVAHERPEAIIKEPLHPTLGLQSFAARKVAYELGFTGKLANQAADIMQKLAKLFVEKDCSLAEINPLVLTGKPSTTNCPNASSPLPNASLPTASLLAIDAKFNFDDNGLFRHPDLQAMADPTEENPAELRAHAAGLSYIALDGNIGCLVNGAGLAMSTMDIVKLHGGTPANFLDVGGSATEEAVTEAFKIIVADPTVKGVLVNIFGGIMKCDIIAQGIINAAKSVGFKVPLVVRLEGTNVEAGRKLLENARAEIPTMQAATDLTDAAQKVCAAVG